MQHAFELHRRADGLVYRFASDKVGVYRRADRPALTIQWDPGFGWIALDPETADVAGMVWGVPPYAQGRCPPEGPWVSCKGAKSYVYDLVHVSSPTAPGAI